MNEPARGSLRRARRVVGVAVLVTVAALVPTASAGAAGRAPGTGKPPAGTGINTPAVFANPLCDKTQGPYGKLDFVIKGGAPDKGGGPICVAVWKGKNNGGATYQGVTKDSVEVVALVPNEQQSAAMALKPTNNANGTAFDGAGRVAGRATGIRARVRGLWPEGRPPARGIER